MLESLNLESHDFICAEIYKSVLLLVLPLFPQSLQNILQSHCSILLLFVLQNSPSPHPGPTFAATTRITCLKIIEPHTFFYITLSFASHKGRLRINSLLSGPTKMFRRPRETQPDPITLEVGEILAPLVIFPWGPLAMNYLGVPIVLGVS